MRRPFAFAALCAALVLPLVIGAPGRAQPGKKGNEKPARVVVYLPESAALYVEGALCPLKSERRSFATAPLEPGKRYEYTLRAEITKNDAKVGVTLTAIVRAGDTTEVRFGDEASFLAAGGLERSAAKPKDKEPEAKPVLKGGAPRFPTAPAPWALEAYIDGDGDFAYKLPGDSGTKYLRPDTFTVYTASGTQLTPRTARERLRGKVTLFVTADAKPLDPFYSGLLAADALVVVPKGPLESGRAARAVLFGLASASDDTLRVRFPDESAARTREEPNANSFGRIRVSRGTGSEHVLELPLAAARGFGTTGRVTTASLETALATESPVLLLESGREPDAGLTRALKSGTRVLVLPVPFRDP